MFEGMLVLGVRVKVLDGVVYKRSAPSLMQASCYAILVMVTSPWVLNLSCFWLVTYHLEQFGSWGYF